MLSSFFLGRGELVIYAAYVLTAISAFLIARMILQEGESLAAAEKLAADGEARKSQNPIVNLTRPFFVQYVVPLIRTRPFWDDQRLVWRRKLISAGLGDQFTPDEFIAFKLFMILFFPLVGGVMNALDFGLSLYWIFGMGIAGFFYPDLWVRSRIQARQKQILRSMPFIVDLLALSTEAGLDFVGAIGKVVEKATPGPLVDEFGQLLREIRVGASRQDALREMALRVGMQEFSSFVTILISADQMGASIGKILRAQSDQVRSERMLRAEKAGAAAAQKVLLPIVLFVVPAVFLMVAAPFALRFIYPDQ